MPISLLPSLLLYILAVGYTPGPANLYAMSAGLRYGRRHALKMWWGLVAGFCLTDLTTTLLCHFLGTVVKPYVVYVKWLGAAYIVWLAWSLWRSSYESNQGDDGNKRDCNFLTGFLVQITNAKMILFELTVFCSYVLPYSDELSALLPITALLLLAGPVANLVWIAMGLSLEKFYTNHKKPINAVMALALVACAMMLVLG